MNYYNENDPFAAEWLRQLISAGQIPQGFVDSRSIVEVSPDDLKEFTQCHFFAGIGGWSFALRLAGWPENVPIWTGSCPCQPFSVAGKQKGKADVRHLWPEFFRLIKACAPFVVMGEQVAGKAGYDWFDGVQFDLDTQGYASRGVDIPALAVDAPHKRQRLYWLAMAYSNPERLQGWERSKCNSQWENGRAKSRSFWGDTEWAICSDRKVRRVGPRVCLLADGVPNRVGKLRGYGNAIVPPLAAEVIKAVMAIL